MSSIAPIIHGPTPLITDLQEDFGGRTAKILNDYLYRVFKDQGSATGHHLTAEEVDTLIRHDTEFAELTNGEELKLEISLDDLVRIYLHRNP